MTGLIVGLVIGGVAVWGYRSKASARKGGARGTGGANAGKVKRDARRHVVFYISILLWST